MDGMERQRVRNWEAAGTMQEQARVRAIRKTDTATAIEQLSDAFESARLHRQSPTTSGLVEQQRLFARLRGEP